MPRPPSEGLAEAEDRPPSGRPRIELQNPSGFAEVRGEDLLPWSERCIARLLAESDASVDPAEVGLTLRFVDDEEMAELNESYRGKEGTTDVLTFPGDLPALAAARSSWVETPAGVEEDGWLFPEHTEPPSFPQMPADEGHHLGDVVISVPTARRQAEKGVERELRVLVLHGVLHALGYDHEVDDGTMERVEADLRRRFVDSAAEAAR